MTRKLGAATTYRPCRCESVSVYGRLALNGLATEISEIN